jgi:hypothetical protein
MRSKAIRITPSGFQYRKIREKVKLMQIEDNPKCRSVVLNDILNKVFSGELCLQDGRNYFQDVMGD